MNQNAIHHKDLVDLQRRLFDAWEERKISPKYRATFITYLDTIPITEAKCSIIFEISRLENFKKEYKAINRYIHQMNLQCSKLKDKIENEENLAQICLILSEIRKLKLLVAELILSLAETEKEENKKEAVIGFCPLFNALHEENKIIKQSFLTGMIKFDQKQFDPFLLSEYENSKKQQQANAHIENLFNLSMSYVYRLMKAHEEMIKYLKYYEQIEDQISDEAMNWKKMTEKNSKEPFNPKKRRSLKYESKLPIIEKKKYHGEDSVLQIPPESETKIKNFHFHNIKETKSLAEKETHFDGDESENHQQLRKKKYHLKNHLSVPPSLKKFQGSIAKNDEKPDVQKQQTSASELISLKRLRQMNAVLPQMIKLSQVKQKSKVKQKYKTEVLELASPKPSFQEENHLKRYQLQKQKKWNKGKFKDLNKNEDSNFTQGSDESEEIFQYKNEESPYLNLRKRKKQKLYLNPLNEKEKPTSFRVKTLQNRGNQRNQNRRPSNDQLNLKHGNNKSANRYKNLQQMEEQPNKYYLVNANQRTKIKALNDEQEPNPKQANPRSKSIKSNFHQNLSLQKNQQMQPNKNISKQNQRKKVKVQDESLKRKYQQKFSKEKNSQNPRLVSSKVEEQYPQSNEEKINKHYEKRNLNRENKSQRYNGYKEDKTNQNIEINKGQKIPAKNSKKLKIQQDTGQLQDENEKKKDKGSRRNYEQKKSQSIQMKDKKDFKSRQKTKIHEIPKENMKLERQFDEISQKIQKGEKKDKNFESKKKKEEKIISENDGRKERKDSLNKIKNEDQKKKENNSEKQQKFKEIYRKPRNFSNEDEKSLKNSKNLLLQFQQKNSEELFENKSPQKEEKKQREKDRNQKKNKKQYQDSSLWKKGNERLNKSLKNSQQSLQENKNTQKEKQGENSRKKQQGRRNREQNSQKKIKIYRKDRKLSSSQQSEKEQSYIQGQLSHKKLQQNNGKKHHQLKTNEKGVKKQTKNNLQKGKIHEKNQKHENKVMKMKNQSEQQNSLQRTKIRSIKPKPNKKSGNYQDEEKNEMKNREYKKQSQKYSDPEMNESTENKMKQSDERQRKEKQRDKKHFKNEKIKNSSQEKNQFDEKKDYTKSQKNRNSRSFESNQQDSSKRNKKPLMKNQQNDSESEDRSEDFLKRKEEKSRGMLEKQQNERRNERKKKEKEVENMYQNRNKLNSERINRGKKQSAKYIKAKGQNSFQKRDSSKGFDKKYVSSAISESYESQKEKLVQNSSQFNQQNESSEEYGNEDKSSNSQKESNSEQEQSKLYQRQNQFLSGKREPQKLSNSKKQLQDSQMARSNKKQINTVKNIQKQQQDKEAQINQSQNKQKNKKRQIKMKPGSFNYHSFLKWISEKEKCIKRKFTYDFAENLKHRNHYLTQFYLNDEQIIFVLCCPNIDNDYEIVCWEKISNQVKDETVYLLLKKYTQYLQKFTTLSSIIFHKQINTDLDKLQLQKISQNLSKMKRMTQISVQNSDYPNFISFQCSNICFGQKNEQKILFSAEIQQFSEKNSKVSKDIALVSPNPKEKLNRELINAIETGKQLNRILDYKKFDTYEIGQIPLKNINLHLFKKIIKIKKNFLTTKGYMIVDSYVVEKEGQKLLIELQLETQCFKIFLGKNLSKIDEMQSLIEKNNPQKQITKAAVKMFSKQLYGRIMDKDLSNKGCYGNWQISFFWEDSLRGKVEHTEIKAQKFDQFYLSLYCGTFHLYSIMITAEDFLF